MTAMPPLKVENLRPYSPVRTAVLPRVTSHAQSVDDVICLHPAGHPARLAAGPPRRGGGGGGRHQGIEALRHRG